MLKLTMLIVQLDLRFDLTNNQGLFLLSLTQFQLVNYSEQVQGPK